MGRHLFNLTNKQEKTCKSTSPFVIGDEHQTEQFIIIFPFVVHLKLSFWATKTQLISCLLNQYWNSVTGSIIMMIAAIELDLRVCRCFFITALLFFAMLWLHGFPIYDYEQTVQQFEYSKETHAFNACPRIGNKQGIWKLWEMNDWKKLGCK